MASSWSEAVTWWAERYGSREAWVAEAARQADRMARERTKGPLLREWTDTERYRVGCQPRGDATDA